MYPVLVQNIIFKMKILLLYIFVFFFVTKLFNEKDILEFPPSPTHDLLVISHIIYRFN